MSYEARITSAIKLYTEAKAANDQEVMLDKIIEITAISQGEFSVQAIANAAR